MLLILALLFCPSLAEEELRGVKQKKICRFASGILYLILLKPLMVNKKKRKSKATPFRQKTHT